MKRAVWVAVTVLALSACNKGPSVDLHNASANEVGKAVQQSGVADSGTIRPGLWESKVTMSGMQMPNMPPEYAARMKQAMASGQTHRQCVTPEDLQKPKGEMFGQDKTCTFEHFTMGGGRIDSKMVCKVENLTHTTTMTGSYTPTTYTLDMNSTGSGPQMGQAMKVHVDARRIGECTGKED